MRTTIKGFAAVFAVSAMSLHTLPASAYFTMTSAQAQSCAGTELMSDGAVGQDAASSTASSSGGDCGDGSTSSAVASGSTSIALGQVSVSGEGIGFQEFNGSFAQASFSERLTIEDVPVGIDNVDIRVVIAFVGVPPAAAFYNSASMEGSVNPQGIFGQVELKGCSADLCVGNPGPVRTETLEQVVTLPRNGLGTFGNIDIFMDARFAIADASSSIEGGVTVEILGVPEARLVSESGVFGSGGVDSDGDGVADSSDNCTLTANASQLDADGDGFGNICDADLNNDCIVNAQDLGIFKSVFFSADATADLNGDGVVNATDLGLFKLQFFAAPGPSEVAVICN